MGNLTDKINSMLRELQEVSDTINGVERRPIQMQTMQNGQPRVVYGYPNAGAGQQAGMRAAEANNRAAYPASITFATDLAGQPDASGESVNQNDLTASAQADANNPYRHVPHDSHDSRINPIKLTAYENNPLMQGIVISEILGKPVSRRPRGLGRRV
jgi:hypothetical protein